MTTGTGPTSTADRVVALSRDLRSESSGTAVLQRLVAMLVEEIPGARSAGVLALDGGELRTPASAGSVARADGFQQLVGDGPSLTAALDEVVVRSDDLAAEERWPEFCPRAVTAGLRSALALPVPLPTGPGAVALHGTEPRALDADSEHLAAGLAAHAAAAVAARDREHLLAAIASRDVIGQAKGILMERYRISAEHAFAVLRRDSQRSNTKLRLVAERVARTGELADAVVAHQE